MRWIDRQRRGNAHDDGLPSRRAVPGAPETDEHGWAGLDGRGSWPSTPPFLTSSRVMLRVARSPARYVVSFSLDACPEGHQISATAFWEGHGKVARSPGREAPGSETAASPRSGGERTSIYEALSARLSSRNRPDLFTALQVVPHIVLPSACPERGADRRHQRHGSDRPLEKADIGRRSESPYRAKAHVCRPCTGREDHDRQVGPGGLALESLEQKLCRLRGERFLGDQHGPGSRDNGLAERLHTSDNLGGDPGSG